MENLMVLECWYYSIVKYKVYVSYFKINTSHTKKVNLIPLKVKKKKTLNLKLFLAKKYYITILKLSLLLLIVFPWTLGNRRQRKSR